MTLDAMELFPPDFSASKTDPLMQDDPSEKARAAGLAAGSRVSDVDRCSSSGALCGDRCGIFS